MVQITWKERVKSLWRNLLTFLLMLDLSMNPMKIYLIFDLIITVSERMLKITSFYYYLTYPTLPFSHPEHTKRSVVYYVPNIMISRIRDPKWNPSSLKENIQRNLLRTKRKRVIKFCKDKTKKAKGVKGIKYAVTYYHQ